MKESLEKLWNEYFSDECAIISSEVERNFMKTAADLREKAVDLLNEQQCEAMDKYIEALYDSEALLLKKAFFKGCDFGASFILEISKSF